MPIKKAITKTGQKANLPLTRQVVISKICTLIAPVWDSTKKRLKQRMTIAEACKEVGIDPSQYRRWVSSDPSIKQLVDDVAQSHREMQQDIAESIVMSGLNGDLKLRPSEKINLAMRVLEKTSPDYNQALKIKTENVNIDIQMSDEEIISRLKELGINNITNNIAYEHNNNTTVSTDAGEYSEDNENG